MIFGLDPGLANVGWAILNRIGSLIACGHIETKKSGRTGDAAARLALVMYDLSEPLRAVEPHALDLTVVIEWPGGAGGFQRAGANPNARATIQTSTTAGAVYGAAYWLLRGRTDRILTPSPVTWRAALARAWGTGRDEASVHAGIVGRHHSLPNLKKKSVPHVMDAIGLAEYGALKPRTQRGT